MKKWIAVTIVLAVLLLTSIGLNAFQMGYNQGNTEELVAPKNDASDDIEWEKYFRLLFSISDVSLFKGTIAGYGMDGTKVFEADFKPSDSIDYSNFPKYVYGYNWISIYLDTPVQLSRITVGSIYINNLNGYILEAPVYYKVNKNGTIAKNK